MKARSVLGRRELPIRGGKTLVAAAGLAVVGGAVRGRAQRERGRGALDGRAHPARVRTIFGGEDANFTTAQFNRAFVLMEYFGYLRRNPNDSPDMSFDGYNFWLGKLNDFGGNYFNVEMVKAFLTSPEYRQRFGQQ